MAIRAVAVVKAGPDIARQSTFMRLFSFATRVKERKLPRGCVSGEFRAAKLKSGLQDGPGFQVNEIESEWNGVPGTSVSAEILR